MREETIELIKKLIKEKVRPILVMDGGNIEFIEYTEDNIVKVQLQGACHGCALASITLKSVVEELLKEHVPEIKAVENIGQNDEDEILDFSL